MSVKIDIDRVSDIIRDVAAEYIMPRYKSLIDNDIDTKSGPNDLVTIADIEAEHALDKILSAEYAGSVVIGEESVSEGSKTLAELHKTDQLTWVVDPVDGTYNFVKGNDAFAVMVACVYNGTVTHGWIYDVPGDKICTTQRGSGVVIEGDQISISGNNDELRNAKGFLAPKYFSPKIREQTRLLENSSAGLSTLGCAAHEYLNIVKGDKKFALYTKMRPWDHLAGTLAVIEAGGHVELWDKAPYMPTEGQGGLLVASSKNLANEIHQTFISQLL